MHGCTVHRRLVKSCGYYSYTVHEQCRLLGERREKKKERKCKKLKTQQTQRGSKLSLSSCLFETLKLICYLDVMNIFAICHLDVNVMTNELIYLVLLKVYYVKDDCFVMLLC